jgi:class 3 adenylate cyclase/pimeloyl-ACP methyl ester carboxylesterase
VEAETRYARNGRVHIAYCTEGEGAPIVFLPGTFMPMDAYEDHPLMARFVARLRSLGLLVLTDRRGIGHSDPLGTDDLSAESWAEDLLAVFDHASIERATIVASFDAGHAAIAMGALHPDRVERLCLINCFADGPRVAAGIGELGRFETALDEGFEATDLDILSVIAPSVADDPRFRAWFDTSGRRGASPSTALALTTAMFTWDITPLLAAVTAPTLVIHRVGNRIVPVDEAHCLGAGLANATVEIVAGDDHVPFVGNVDPVLDAIESFVTGAIVGAAQRSLATVLFTDLVSSTESAARLGDRRWRELLDVHDTTAKRIVRRHAGEVVKSTGDGLLALFDTPGAAIHAAKDLQADIRALGLEMRAGIHTGEIERRGTDIGGIAVHVASRVQGLAGAGEIVVSAVIPALTSGAEFNFDDLGEHQLKGVPGDWRLFRAG